MLIACTCASISLKIRASSLCFDRGQIVIIWAYALAFCLGGASAKAVPWHRTSLGRAFGQIETSSTQYHTNRCHNVAK